MHTEEVLHQCPESTACERPAYRSWGREKDLPSAGPMPRLSFFRSDVASGSRSLDNLLW